MELRKHYSLAIYPPKDTTKLLDGFKKLLRDHIDWYPSSDSKPHLTIINFNATGKEINSVKSFLKMHCDKVQPFQVNLNGFDTYKTHTIFVSPDQHSKRSLKIMMKALKIDFPIKKEYSSSDPHLSIARGLDKTTIQVALHLFKEVQTSFSCDNIVLRVLNQQKGQYDVIETFDFKGVTSLFVGHQLPLFKEE